MLVVSCRMGREGPGRIPDGAEFAEEVEQLFGADGVAEVLDKERSGEIVSRWSGLGRDRMGGCGADEPVHFGGKSGVSTHSLASVFSRRRTVCGGSVDCGRVGRW